MRFRISEVAQQTSIANYIMFFSVIVTLKKNRDRVILDENLLRKPHTIVLQVYSIHYKMSINAPDSVNFVWR